MDTQNINKLADAIAEVYKRELLKDGVSPNGELANFSYKFSIDGNEFKLYFDLPDYWKYAEYGRRPGKQPPVNNILNWIKIKRLVPRSIQGKIPSSRSLAFMIARSIGEKGTKGKHSLEKALQNPLTTGYIEQIKDEIIQEHLDLIIDEINKLN